MALMQHTLGALPDTELRKLICELVRQMMLQIVFDPVDDILPVCRLCAHSWRTLAADDAAQVLYAAVGEADGHEQRRQGDPSRLLQAASCGAMGPAARRHGRLSHAVA